MATELRELIAAVDDWRFREACTWALNTAGKTGSPGTDDGSEWPERIRSVPGELEALIWDDERTTLEQRVALAFALYHEMPSYGALASICRHVPDFDAATQELFWREYRDLLSAEDDRLATPVAYSLWRDLFPDAEQVDDAWRQVTSFAHPYLRRMERVLAVSGPVPFAPKLFLYERLLPDIRWHGWIFRSLFHSAFDANGLIDPVAARRLLGRLRLSPELDDEFFELRSRLAA